MSTCYLHSLTDGYFILVSDPVVLAELDPWAETVSNYSDRVIGKAHVYLDGTRPSCRVKECNMANLVADAFLWSLITFPDDEKWNEVSIAVIPAGTVRASIKQGQVFNHIVRFFVSCIVTHI